MPYTTPSVGNTVLSGVGHPTLYSGLKKGPMIDDVIVHVATDGVVNPVDATLTDLVVHVFVDVKLVNGYDTAREPVIN